MGDHWHFITTWLCGCVCFAGILADQVFNPLLREGGLLASSVGKVIGTGEGRGIGLLFIISGLLIIIMAFVIPRMKSIRCLERE